jgi:hypothetical protein
MVLYFERKDCPLFEFSYSTETKLKAEYPLANLSNVEIKFNAHISVLQEQGPWISF